MRIGRSTGNGEMPERAGEDDMAATRAYAPETRPLYGAGTRTSSSREFTGRTSGWATMSYGAPARSRDYGYADYG